MKIKQRYIVEFLLRCNRQIDKKKELLEYAERQGLVVDEENIYVDVIIGYSVGEDRVQYSKMLEDIEKKGIRKILFSELTRLGRNSVELLSEIQRLQDMNIHLYFQKQDLWIRDKQDLGSRILLAVLAITTSYEIELFAERSISGKINKIHKGGGVGGDNNSYGYKNDENNNHSQLHIPTAKCPNLNDVCRNDIYQPVLSYS